MIIVLVRSRELYLLDEFADLSIITSDRILKPLLIKEYPK